MKKIILAVMAASFLLMATGCPIRISIPLISQPDDRDFYRSLDPPKEDKEYLRDMEMLRRRSVNVRSLEINGNEVLATFSGYAYLYLPDCARFTPEQKVFHISGRKAVYSDLFLTILQDAQKNKKKVIVYGTGKCSIRPDIETLDEVGRGIE